MRDPVTAGQQARSEQSTDVPRVARQEVHDSAPALGWYTDHVLYHEVWNRPGLNKRDRSLITVASLICAGRIAQLRSHTLRALENGITSSELLEVLTHCAFYSGWPLAMSALPVISEILKNAGEDTPREEALGTYETGEVAGSGLYSQPGPLADSYQGVIRPYLDAVVAKDLWNRPGLASRDRILITVAALLAVGHLEELVSVVEMGLNDGLTAAEVAEVLGHLAFYVGFPAAAAAGRRLDRSHVGR